MVHTQTFLHVTNKILILQNNIHVHESYTVTGYTTLISFL